MCPLTIECVLLLISMQLRQRTQTFEAAHTHQQLLLRDAQVCGWGGRGGGGGG